MAYIDFVFKVSSLALFFIIGTTSRPTTVPKVFTTVPKVFDVQRYGANGDGKTNNTKAFTDTWKDACTWDGPSKMYIPNGRFYLGGVSFVGPCTSNISFVIDGTLLAPPNNNDIKKETWINFRYIDYLTVSGNGTIDGQGKESWLLNDCQKNINCPKFAINMGFYFVNKSRMEGITSLNSKAGHFSFFSVDHFNITGVNITAPGDSPNTDGIKMASSSSMQISNTHISTGDDCIAMLSGNTNFDIYNVTCGPGHGISGDSHIQIQNVTLKNIWGTSSNKVAVKFQCSKSFPCKNVHSSDINLKHNGVDGPAITLCENIKGSATGKMNPPHCLN
ncbi:PREDICTED: exopolygalacturonase-like [Camelina sativa]|uniref:Exopolygalacturonase-like n=1 Tax=Camelina sativa TaxID=90675 RepID=A0ABM0X4H5_CAMSA|nr:PREDICTED: exopolygalacturonase-like [Camelina sativa]